eukprot:g6712.t1
MGVQRLDRLGRGKVISQGRDSMINVWDAERLAGDGGSGNGLGKVITPEPLQQLPTGAFHFCQFALTRWRGEELGAGKEKDKDKENGNSYGSGSGFDDGGVGRRRETGDRSGHGESEKQERELLGRGEKGPAAGVATAAAEAAAAPAPKPPPPLPPPLSPPEEAGGEARVEEPCTSDRSAFEENMMLAPCGEQHSISLWDLRKGKPSFTFSPKDAERKGMVMCVRLMGESPSCTSPFAVTGHDSGHLCVYDLRATSAEPLLQSRLHTAPLLCVDVGSSCEQGVSGSADESIKVFRMSTRKASCEAIKTFPLDHPGTSCVEIRRDHKLFVSGGWDHRVRAFSWKSLRPLAVLRSHDKNVHTVAYSPRIGGLASGSGDSRVAVWDLFPNEKPKARCGDVHVAKVL